jgi:arylsulfatase A-like enzyme
MIAPKAATLSELPTDATAVSEAIGIYERSDRPTFLWLHLMGSHRPYGWGDDALPTDIGRTAASASPSALSPGVTDNEAESIRKHYSDSLARVSDHIETLVDAVADDAIVAAVGDHGEEFGEDGYWFHGPYRQRLVDTIVDVPLAVRGLTAPAGMSTAALPSLLATAANVSPADAWVSATDMPITVAPWDGSASVRIGDLVLDGANIDDAGSEQTRNISSQLRALGYQ